MIKRAEYLLLDSGAISILEEGMLRSTKGRKSNRKDLELLFIGMLLSIQDRHCATIKSIHQVLTEDLTLDQQLHLGVATGSYHDQKMLKVSALYNQVRKINNCLAYGFGSRLKLDEYERERRRQVVVAFSNTLNDCVLAALPVDHTTLAVDGSGHWAWSRGGTYLPPTPEEIEAIEDPELRELLRQLIDEEGENAKGSKSEAVKLARKHMDIGTNSKDDDAGWGGKTAKNGKEELFFGYMMQTIVTAPVAKLADDPNELPPLIRRIELTRAAENPVDVTFRQLDSLPVMPENLLCDRLYSNMGYEDWQLPLLERGIRQHFDLRSDNHGAVVIEQMKYVDGTLHCPGLPEVLEEIQRPGVFASKKERADFRQLIEQRQQYALDANEQMNINRSIKVRCPAMAGKVGCPHRGNTDAAIELGQPIIENPPTATEGEALPRCCTNEKGYVRVTLEPAQAKLNQIHPWGTEPWDGMFGRRAYVEGVFGNIKNPGTENLSRGTFQIMGITWANLAVSVIGAAYNTRSIRKWHARTGLGTPGNVLVENDQTKRVVVECSPELEAQTWAAHERDAQPPLEDFGELAA
jgi:hypothetical protein